MNLPEPVAWRHAGSEMITKNPAVVKAMHHVEWEGLFAEAQLREALAQQEAVMRQVLDAMHTPGDYESQDKALKALEDALK